MLGDTVNNDKMYWFNFSASIWLILRFCMLLVAVKD